MIDDLTNFFWLRRLSNPVVLLCPIQLKKKHAAPKPAHHPASDTCYGTLSIAMLVSAHHLEKCVGKLLQMIEATKKGSCHPTAGCSPRMTCRCPH